MADKDKQVYLTRKSGSTFSNATVNIKDSASAKNADTWYLKVLRKEKRGRIKTTTEFC